MWPFSVNNVQQQHGRIIDIERHVKMNISRLCRLAGKWHLIYKITQSILNWAMFTWAFIVTCVLVQKYVFSVHLYAC